MTAVPDVIFGLMVLGSLLGFTALMVFLVESDATEVFRVALRSWWALVRPSDVDKAEREMQKEIDKRTAQLIREHGLDRRTAADRATREYRDELKAATPGAK